MPPKKKLCRSKDQRSIIEVFRGSSDESENSSNDQTKPKECEGQKQAAGREPAQTDEGENDS